MSHFCIAPACPKNCDGCNHAISQETVLEYARRYAWLRDVAPSSTWDKPVVCQGSRDLGDAHTLLGGSALDDEIDRNMKGSA